MSRNSLPTFDILQNFKPQFRIVPKEILSMRHAPLKDHLPLKTYIGII